MLMLFFFLATKLSSSVLVLIFSHVTAHLVPDPFLARFLTQQKMKFHVFGRIESSKNNDFEVRVTKKRKIKNLEVQSEVLVTS